MFTGVILNGFSHLLKRYADILHMIIAVGIFCFLLSAPK